MMLKPLITIIIGARPQFIKHQPLQEALEKSSQIRVLHTGQHYDEKMSKVFFQELGIRTPDVELSVGSSSHGQQTGKMLELIEKDLQQERPCLVIVYGDTNSTLAGALAASKLQIPVAHVEAGLRSFNRAMPEEINRILTDHCSELLFVPSDTGRAHLSQEGIKKGVFFVGDIMFDAVLHFREKAHQESRLQKTLKLETEAYYYATIHRPANTDSRSNLQNIISAFGALDFPVVFPVHPRTAKMLQQYQISFPKNVLPQDPLGYLDNIVLLENAKAVLTDSGGLQKEAFYLKTPCLTIRPETEWPETIDQGWNQLISPERDSIIQALSNLEVPSEQRPVYGKGNSAIQITEIIMNWYRTCNSQQGIA